VVSICQLGDVESDFIWVPRAVVDAKRQTSLDLIYNCTDTESVSMLRMRKAPFFNLWQLFRERHLLEDSLHSTIEEHVAMFLHIVGHNQSSGSSTTALGNP
jgi:hypothetical protein